MEEKTCPKCGSKMLADKNLGSGAIEASLIRENEFRGDDIKTYYCRNAVLSSSTGGKENGFLQ